MALTEILPWIKRVLVLEDNYIIALEAEDILRSLGIEHIEIASDTAEANRLIEAQSFDFALLDVSLGNETSFDFAGLLLARGVAFGFVSGYGDDSVFPVALRDIPRISKPFNETSMGSLLASAG